MTNLDTNRVAAPSLKSFARRPFQVSDQSVVRIGSLNEDQFPLLIEPNIDSAQLEAWVQENRDDLEERLLRHGAILFRGFGVAGVEEFENVARSMSPDLIEYQERAAPRVKVGAKVYTSTEFPADQSIPLHHEMSYSHNWPTKIWFYCVQPAESGGRTPITDDRKVFQRISPEIKRSFLEKGVMYVRNYGEELDLPWQDVFQTTSKAEVEDYCRKAGIEFEWLAGNGLRTRQVRQVVTVHPKTGDTVWFNHAHMFHISNLQPAVREALLTLFTEDEIPRNAFYGDGSPIAASTLDQIRQIYEESAVRFDWRKGDILLLDNFLSSHGREPFTGLRKVVVAMSDLYTNSDLGSK